ncbi:ATP-binding protein [Actinosynnema sp. NPDC047251]|uniref:histidine kinase n=1 Tax=Saccharothrix espanaensis (strain ATCC 51144 / DSM 44229 / JCM 9112 / NBRC 15066 / NRRL 15764) TaxID=1179773 RepID=K0K1P8_SACES|nr:ATP-binding protein [Saccharothrix espanaensis]CCH30789.1 Two-component system, sensor histidine kinase [Saccharothrix espanaensis DSM 44229]
MRSLRTRLLVAFLLLCGVTATVVAGVTYVRARTVLLEKAQVAAVEAFTGKVAEMTEPNADVLADRYSAGLVLYKGRKLVGGVDFTDLVSPELRARVTGGEVAWQRVEERGHAGLVMGMRVSDVEIYASRSMVAEQASIRELALFAWIAAGCSMVVAVLLALLAARSVLRPVRELREAAQRLGEGDLTTRVAVRGSDELAGVAATFNTTARALERQVAEARRFVADVSHELRTPLAAMTAVTDVLDEEAEHLPGDAGTAARLVSQETRNLTRLVDDLIEVSRFDSGAAVLALDEVDVAAAVGATLRLRGWTDLTTDLAPATALVDPRRLDVVVANLVGNALKHGAPPITLTVRAEPGVVVVEVADRGPGLDPAVLPRVFDRFYKADSARARSEGSGLGLAIAWENAALHGGSLVAANRPGGGAVFTLRLPSRGDR